MIDEDLLLQVSEGATFRADLLPFARTLASDEEITACMQRERGIISMSSSLLDVVFDSKPDGSCVSCIFLQQTYATRICADGELLTVRKNHVPARMLCLQNEAGEHFALAYEHAAKLIK